MNIALKDKKSGLQKRLLLFIILVFSLILRLYNVSDKPQDLYIDEIAIGWNAYTILKTGQDEFGQFIPLWFRSYNDYKLPVYIYLTTASEFLFGKSAIAVRLPSVIFGSLTILIFIKLIQLLNKSNKLALISGLFLAVSPWHLHFSRAGFEATVSLFLMVFALYLILLEFKSAKKTFFWGVLFIITALYTYHTPRLVGPLKLLAVAMLYPKKTIASLKHKRVFIWIPVLILILVPFSQYSLSPQGLIRAQSESFLKDEPGELRKDIEETMQWGTLQLTKNFLTHFSLDFLFFAGDSIGRHSVREIGMNYLWQLPFFLIGIIIAIKKRGREYQLFFSWLLVSPVAAALTTPTPHALRSIPESIPIVYFISFGFLQTFSHISKYKSKLYSIFKHLIICIFAYNMLFYLHIYYTHYPIRASVDWSSGLKETILYILNNESKYEKIAISRSIDNSYAFFYFYSNFDPYLLLKTNYKDKFGKFIFVDQPFFKPKEKTLYIDESVAKWDGKLIKIINNRGGDPAYNIWEN